MNVLHFIYDLVHDYAIIAVVVVFVLIWLWAYWPSHKTQLQQHASIPLDDGA